MVPYSVLQTSTYSLIMVSTTIFELYQDFLDSSFLQRVFGWLISISLNTYLVVGKRRRLEEEDIDIIISQAEMTCLILSLINTIYAWTKQKKYRFFGRDLLQRPKVANARLINKNLPYFAQNMLGDYMYELKFNILRDFL